MGKARRLIDMPAQVRECIIVPGVKPMTAVTQRQLSSQTEEFMRVLQRHLPELRQAYGVRALWLFGSYV